MTHGTIRLLHCPVFQRPARRPIAASNGCEQIAVVIAEPALGHRRETFESHAGIDARLRERIGRACAVAVELHEHQVPDLNDPVPSPFGVSSPAPMAPGRSAVRARPGARVGHLPEVVLLAWRTMRLGDTPIFRHNRSASSSSRKIVIHIRSFEARPPTSGTPSRPDGLLLEVIAEGKVAEHFEEGVMASGSRHFRGRCAFPGTQTFLPRAHGGR